MFSVLSVALWFVLAGQVMDVPLTTATDFYRQGMSWMRAGNPAEALRLFKRAVELRPDYPEAYYGRGMAYIALRLYPKAVADFNKAIELKEDYAEAYTSRGRACLNFTPKSEGCLRDLDRAVRLNPNHAEGYVVRALFYAERRDLRRAQADLDQAVKLQPHNADALFARASVLLGMGNKSAAIDDFKRVVEFGNPALAKRARRSLQQMGAQ